MFSPLTVSVAEDIYNECCRRFHSPAACLLRAQFQFVYRKSTAVGLVGLERADEGDSALDESFSVFFLRRLHKESFVVDGGNRDLITFIGSNLHT